MKQATIITKFLLILLISGVLLACGTDDNDNGGDSSNQPPTISGTPTTTVNEGNFYHFAPMAADSDSGDTLTFSINNKPAWASFDNQTGILSGTPGLSDAGDYDNITISVSDGTATAELAAFMISVVNNTNQPPTITGTPATTVNEDSPYHFAPIAADADSGDSLTFAISNKPSWAGFDNQTGILSGTPSLDDAGDYGNIIISVSDGTASAQLSVFTISVIDVSPALLISTHSPTAQAIDTPLLSNITITFDTPLDTATVSGTSATLLETNSVVIPATLNIDNQTITIDPTSNLEPLTTYTVIITTAVTGTNGAALDNDYSWSFTTLADTVIDPSRITVNLSWNIGDTSNTNISPSGYLIYYGRQSGSLANSIDVGMVASRALNGSEFNFTEIGEYYFQVVAYNADKSLFSAPSTEVIIDIHP
ncbi:MAG: putative Ig domain-containing protein [Gammaproteobacteria bacterium]|nr:putative Ig domain-containing protein [Gammaproteobacteria bacterium]MCF6261854.1 putative Ig domain-containing protein [Gammaproteobacteria bacterium]